MGRELGRGGGRGGGKEKGKKEGMVRKEKEGSERGQENSTRSEGISQSRCIIPCTGSWWCSRGLPEGLVHLRDRASPKMTLIIVMVTFTASYPMRMA